MAEGVHRNARHSRRVPFPRGTFQEISPERPTEETALHVILLHPPIHHADEAEMPAGADRHSRYFRRSHVRVAQGVFAQSPCLCPPGRPTRLTLVAGQDVGPLARFVGAGGEIDAARQLQSVRLDLVALGTSVDVPLAQLGTLLVSEHVELAKSVVFTSRQQCLAFSVELCVERRSRMPFTALVQARSVVVLVKDPLLQGVVSSCCNE
mmetsp:Transcript_705/g.1315  ORF Transcript_705/g.1315 Transcript_705/m.1315 type:complete len:208 (-) Transcript_705:1006-1629(-)